MGIVPPFQRPSVDKALQLWRLAYQVPLSTPVSARLCCSRRRWSSRPSSAAGSVLPVGDTGTYGEVMQDPARARATVQLYRTFLLSESWRTGRYASARLTVPTRLVNGPATRSPAVRCSTAGSRTPTT
jgi:hypothetical protein